MAEAYVDADWLKIVGTKTIGDGGRLGDILEVARVHIDAAVTDNRLTQDQAGAVYTAMLPAAIEFAIQYEFRR